MKSLNKALREWLLERRGRGMALAEKLDCSRQYISEISKMETGLSLTKWDEIQWAMLEVESNERGDFSKVRERIQSVFDDDGTDYVTDIRNHIAPTTVVIER